MKTLFKLSLNFLIALMLTVCVGLPAIAAPAIVVGGFLLPQMPGLGMALQVEMWQKDIVAPLFADNSFLSKAFNADQYVLAGSVVHIPESGGASTVTKNRSELPATAVKRTDTDKTYTLAEYTTAPRLVTDAEKVELSYDKRNSIIAEDKAGLVEAVANNMIYDWSPATAAQILRTTGDAVVAHLASATGNRCKITLSDIARVAALMNQQDVPQDGRYCLIDAWMYQQLVDAMSPSAYRDFIAGIDPKTGTVGKIFGYDVYMRSLGAKYTNATTPAKKLYTTAGAATDNAAALFWQTNMVERALGTVQMFDDPKNPLYYGDIISFLVRAGGRIRRDYDKGVVALVQAATT